MRRSLVALLALVTLAALPVNAAEVNRKPAPPAKARSAASAKSAAHAGPDSLMKPETFTGLELRSIGPAMNSGRIIDLAVHPTQRATWYVAVACGGVWKTVNAGTTWTPIFDEQGSVLDRLRDRGPEEPAHRLGRHRREQQPAQRGLRRRRLQVGGRREELGERRASRPPSTSAGSCVDPRDSEHRVYVAAQGPLWADGGDRGLYKTADGGKTWKKVLDDRARAPA